MMKRYELTGQLTEDATGLVFDHGNAVARVLHRWVGKDLEIVIQPLRRQRSLRQNRYLHGVIVPIIGNHLKEVTGVQHSIEHIKSFVYTSVLGNQFVEKDLFGELVLAMEGKRFSQMTTKEFSDAVETVQQYFAELDVYIPDPEPEKGNFLNDFLR